MQTNVTRIWELQKRTRIVEWKGVVLKKAGKEKRNRKERVLKGIKKNMKEIRRGGITGEGRREGD